MRKQLAIRKIDMQSIGKRLSNLIEVQYESAAAFADDVGISRNSLYKILHGEVTPDAQTLVDFCEKLGCSVDFLLGVSCPETDPVEGFEAALLNVYEFRRKWPRGKILFLVYAAMGMLSDKEEQRLRVHLKAD